jgi:hypothetical protein
VGKTFFTSVSVFGAHRKTLRKGQGAGEIFLVSEIELKQRAQLCS